MGSQLDGLVRRPAPCILETRARPFLAASSPVLQRRQARQSDCCKGTVAQLRCPGGAMLSVCAVGDQCVHPPLESRSPPAARSQRATSTSRRVNSWADTLLRSWTAYPSDIQKAEGDGRNLQVTAALTASSDLELPEELMPLVDALEQAKMRVDQVSALREALETKVASPTLTQLFACQMTCTTGVCCKAMHFHY